MYQFLISNANYETLTVISAIILLALISLWIHTKKDQIEFIAAIGFLPFLIVITFICLLITGYGWTQKMEVKQMRPADVYTINKTGEIITFKKKYFYNQKIFLSQLHSIMYFI